MKIVQSWYINGTMAYQFKLQVPISESLNKKLKERAEEIGFSSVNEIARLLLTNFANKKLNISFIEPSTETASPELEKIIEAGLKEYKARKTKKLNPKKSFHEQLMN